MLDRKQNIIFISIIVLLLFITTAVAVKIINDENNKYIVETNYPENSYKIGIIGDTVISVLYKSNSKLIDIYYYDENNQFISYRHASVYRDRGSARDEYVTIEKNKSSKIEELCMYRNMFTYVVKAENISDDKKITVNKQELLDKIRENFNGSGYTEII